MRVLTRKASHRQDSEDGNAVKDDLHSPSKSQAQRHATTRNGCAELPCLQFAGGDLGLHLEPVVSSIGQADEPLSGFVVKGEGANNSIQTQHGVPFGEAFYP